MTTYKILRFFSDGRKATVVAKGLSLEDAKAHCSREDTHKFKKDGSLVWFDGFTTE